MKKISTKIIVLLGLLVLFICLGLGLVAYVTFHNSLVDVLDETMPKVAMEASVTIEDGIQNQINKLNIIASLDYMDILNNPDEDSNKVRSIMADEVRRSGHKQMILIDKSGRALYDNGTVGNLKGNHYFEEALSGKEVVSEPMLDYDGSGIIMIYAVPVKVGGNTAGVLMAVRDGLELSDIAGRIKFGKTGEAFIINKQGRTIAHADTNVLLGILKEANVTVDESDSKGNNETEAVSSATAVEGVSSATVDGVSSSTPANGDNAGESPDSGAIGNLAQKIGFESFTDVQLQMMEGKTGFGEYKYNEITKIAGYAPIEKYGWSIAVAVDKDEMLSGLSDLKLTFLIISLLFLLAGFSVAYFIGKGISRPIVHLSHECNIMSNGDFSRSMAEKYIKRPDEIGDLARSFNNINVKVSRIIRNVIDEATSVGKAIENVDKHMEELTSEINHMSDIIKKLSSKMEENSAAAEEMNAISNEIEGAIDSIANETHHNAETAHAVSQRAEKLKETAINSQKRAEEIRSNVAVKLRNALEQSKTVEKIKLLSDAVLDISSKTNLLALNASIEASNAGAAGSGFAVVAREIRNLSEDSKQTVSKIQSVTKSVTESVQALSEGIEEVLDFLENQVEKDYGMLVETGEQYDNDAQLLNGMVSSLSATTEQLYVSIQSMVNVINDVAVSAEAGASETLDLANKAAGVVDRTTDVLKKTNEVNRSADKLLKLVSIFRVK